MPACCECLNPFDATDLVKGCCEPCRSELAMAAAKEKRREAREAHGDWLRDQQR